MTKAAAIGPLLSFGLGERERAPTPRPGMALGVHRGARMSSPVSGATVVPLTRHVHH